MDLGVPTSLFRIWKNTIDASTALKPYRGGMRSMCNDTGSSVFEGTPEPFKTVLKSPDMFTSAPLSHVATAGLVNNVRNDGSRDFCCGGG